MTAAPPAGPAAGAPRGGWIMVETVVALTILVMLLASLSLAEQTARRFNAIQLARQRCTAAGQAELDSIAATGEPIAEAELARLWPGIRAEIARSPGRGEWAALTRVKVTAEAVADGRQVKVELARYVAPGRKQP